MIVTRKDMESMTPERRPHYLNENAVRVMRSLGEITGLKGLGVHHVELEPGRDSTEYHFHHAEEECVFMLSGELELLLGDERHTLRAGDFVGHPAGGAAHLMRNVSDSVATYLLFGQRLTQDTVDYPHAGKRLVINGDDMSLLDLPEFGS